MDQFITIPETKLPGGLVVPAFQAGKFLCSKGDDGKAVIVEDRAPWVRINYHDARKACEEIGGQLETESQRIALAYIAQNNANNLTPSGKLFRGIRKSNVSSAQPGNYVPSDPKERRFIELTDGQTICDINGNAYSWIFDDVQGDEQGLIAKPFASDSPSITTAQHPSQTKGQGWFPDAGTNWSGRALIRGGCWRSGSNAGVFCLSLGWPINDLSTVGFRCTKSL